MNIESNIWGNITPLSLRRGAGGEVEIAAGEAKAARTKSLLILLFFFITSLLLAQTAKEDFKKINDAYKTGFISMKVSYRVYKDATAADAMEKEDGEVKKMGDLVYSKIGGMELVQAKEYAVSVDNYDKLITINNISNKEADNSKQVFFDMEKMLGMCSKADYASVNDQQATYTLTCPSIEYEKVVVTFDKKTHFITKLVLFFNERKMVGYGNKVSSQAPRLEIIYSGISTVNDGKTSEYFTYNKYLKKQADGKLICNDTYKAYKLINQLEISKQPVQKKK